MSSELTMLRIFTHHPDRKVLCCGATATCEMASVCHLQCHQLQPFVGSRASIMHRMHLAWSHAPMPVAVHCIAIVPTFSQRYIVT